MSKVFDEEIRYFKVELEEIFEKLREYFTSRGDVLIAVLFGSITRRNTVRDVDIAVYMREKPDLDDILGMTCELEKLLGIPVDLTPLDRALPEVRLKAMSEGKPIVVRDKALYTELLKEAIAELEDFKRASKQSQAFRKTK